MQLRGPCRVGVLATYLKQSLENSSPEGTPCGRCHRSHTPMCAENENCANRNQRKTHNVSPPMVLRVGFATGHCLGWRRVDRQLQ